MNQCDKVFNALREAMLKILKQYNNGLSKHQMEDASKLELWATTLAKRNYTVEQVSGALISLKSQNPNFMPSVFAIIENAEKRVSPKVTASALEVELVEFVRLHSPDLEGNYFHELSEPARKLVNLMGGTREIRNYNPDFLNKRIERTLKDLGECYESISGDYKKLSLSPSMQGLNFIDMAKEITGEGNDRA